MYIDTTFPPPGSGRLAQFMRMVEAFERDEIEIAVDALIARLDAADGDSDVELNGDECDATDSHEESADFPAWLHDLGPGDPDDAEDDTEDRGEVEDAETASWPEQVKQGPCLTALDEDEDGDDGIADRVNHRNRIRRTRCHRTLHRGPGGLPFATYRLRSAAQ